MSLMKKLPVVLSTPLVECSQNQSSPRYLWDRLRCAKPQFYLGTFTLEIWRIQFQAFDFMPNYKIRAPKAIDDKQN